jgi:hypothetical protein
MSLLYLEVYSRMCSECGQVHIVENWDNSVGIMLHYALEGWISIPGGEPIDISLLHINQTRPGDKAAGV